MKPFGAHQCKWVRVFLCTVFWGSLIFRAQALPDLIVIGPRAAMTVEYESRSFSTADCAYQEGCVRGGGIRKLLKLDVGIRNVGATDLVIGDPTRRPDLFVWSPCHGHYHMKGLATYRVLAPSGTKVAKTYKQGFCLRDDTQKMATAGPAKYTCDYQGISRGWQDTYDKSLDCQWVDVTGIPAGRYYLEITCNPNRVFAESNYGNNRVIFPITIPKKVF